MNIVVTAKLQKENYYLVIPFPMPNTEFIMVENCLRNNTKPDGNDDNDIFVYTIHYVYTINV